MKNNALLRFCDMSAIIMSYNIRFMPIMKKYLHGADRVVRYLTRDVTRETCHYYVCSTNDLDVMFTRCSTFMRVYL